MPDSGSMTVRRALTAILFVGVVAAVTGARAVGRDDTGPSPARGLLTPALVQGLRLDPGSVRGLGNYGTKAGARIEVAYARRTSGAECLVAVGGGSAGSACGGLYARGPVAILQRSSGGPELERRSELEVIGLARPIVARVALVDTAGRTRWPALNEDRTFMVELTPEELRAGVGPAELVAYDRAGAELMRLDLTEPDS
jgi:hypothetical protein